MTLMTHFACLHLFSSRDLRLHSTLAGTLVGAPAAWKAAAEQHVEGEHGLVCVDRQTQLHEVSPLGNFV